jgi:hypothetical protein
LVAVALVMTVAWTQRYRIISPPILSVGLGNSYPEIVKNSTYAVRDHSTPPQEYLGFGSVWIDAPATQLRFSDPQHGFILPPTRFAMVTLMHGKVETITTSPMLDALPFDNAIALVNRLQADFRRGGWEPIERSGERPPSWFNTASAAGLVELRRGSTRELVVPHKYAMYFNFKCWTDCGPAPNEKSRYLIDVSMGVDH